MVIKNIVRRFFEPCSLLNRALLICVPVVIGMSFAVIYHYVRFHYLEDENYSTFLFNPKKWGEDLKIIWWGVQLWDPYITKVIYFPFTFLPFWPIHWLSIDFVYPLFAVMVFGCSASIIFRSTVGMSTLHRVLITHTIGIISLPVIYCIDRGNLDGWVFFWLTLFWVLFQRKQYFFAGFFLAGAIAMKVYCWPLIFLYTRLHSWKKHFASVGVLTCLLSLAAAVSFPGGILRAWNEMNESLPLWKQMHIIDHIGIYHNTSWFNVVTIIVKKLGGVEYKQILAMTLLPYSIFNMLVLALVSYISFFKQAEDWEKLCFLVPITILGPHVSYEYRLLALLIPLSAFISKKEIGRFDSIIAICFGLILIPKNYFTISAEGQIISANTILNILLLTIIMVLSLRSVWQRGSREV